MTEEHEGVMDEARAMIMSHERVLDLGREAASLYDTEAIRIPAGEVMALVDELLTLRIKVEQAERERDQEREKAAAIYGGLDHATKEALALREALVDTRDRWGREVGDLHVERDRLVRQRVALAVALGNMLDMFDAELTWHDMTAADLELEDQAVLQGARKVLAAHKSGTLDALLDRWDEAEKKEDAAASQEAAP